MKTDSFDQLASPINFGQKLRQLFIRDLRKIKGCDPEIAAKVEKLQLTQVQSALPYLIAFHIVASFAFGFTLWHYADIYYFLSWSFGAIIPTSLLLIVCIQTQNPEQSRNTIRYLDLSGIVLAIVWASIPMIHGNDLSDKHQVELLGLILAMIGIVSLALARVPTAAILFIGLVTAAIATQIFLRNDKNAAIGTVYCVVYGIIVIGFIINSHFDFIKRSIVEYSAKRQQDTITLLLNEFQTGSGDWLWGTDQAHKLNYFSPRLLQLTGLTEDAIKGLSFQELFAPTPEALGWEYFAGKIAAHDDVEAVTLAVTIANSCVYWQMTARAFYDKNNEFEGYRGVCRDFTERFETEQKVMRAMAAAESANAAKTQFLAVMSHELRTPINAITGFSEVLLAEQDVALTLDVQRDYLKTILESAKHLQLLINDILDATRIERGAFKLVEQPSDAAELVEIAGKMCRDQADKSDTTVILRLIDGVDIECDLTRMKQVILNLMTNAIKFSPPGGIVNIEMRRAAGDSFVLSIADAGVGIKAEDMERIFEPFVQAEDGANRRFGGVGLGLAIARKIARLHGGDITLESQPGAGTTAFLTLPASRIRWPIVKPKNHVAVAA